MSELAVVLKHVKTLIALTPCALSADGKRIPGLYWWQLGSGASA